MALKSVYDKFLAKPELELLASDSSLHYITTTTTYTNPEDILKHITALRRIVKKHSEKILNTVEGTNSLCLDVETKLEFIGGGGPYFLSLDDNFVVDNTVTFPMIHIVHFDSQNKISQIRLYWDQGSLLKQIEVIGPRNRSWPICDGADQTKLINRSIAAAAKTAPTQSSSSTSQSNKGKVEEEFISPKKRNPKDPHASLSLFEQNNFDDEPIATPRTSKLSAKPPPRDYNELFGGTGNDDEPDVTPTKKPAPGTRKASHAPSTLFEQNDFVDEPIATPRTSKLSAKPPPRDYNDLFGDTGHDNEPDVLPAKKPVPNAQKAKSQNYNHFEFGEAEPEVPRKTQKKVKQISHFEFGDEPSEDEPQPLPVRPRSSKHMPQWGFDDFATPEKPRGKVRSQDVRHFGWGDDDELSNTPQPTQRAVHPRRDAEPHFTFQDDGTPGPEDKSAARPKGKLHTKSMSLYENNIYDESGKEPSEADAEKPLSNAANGTGRRKDFEPHWMMTDEPSPAASTKQVENKHVASDRMKAVKMMDSSWDSYDDENKAPVAPPPRRIKRDVNQKSWGFGDED